eukprot:Partr_v1_DN27237_c0_g1_i1_m38894 putative CSRP2 binding protein
MAKTSAPPPATPAATPAAAKPGSSPKPKIAVEAKQPIAPALQQIKPRALAIKPASVPSHPPALQNSRSPAFPFSSGFPTTPAGQLSSRVIPQQAHLPPGANNGFMGNLPLFTISTDGKPVMAGSITQSMLNSLPPAWRSLISNPSALSFMRSPASASTVLSTPPSSPHLSSISQVPPSRPAADSSFPSPRPSPRVLPKSNSASSAGGSNGRVRKSSANDKASQSSSTNNSSANIKKITRRRLKVKSPAIFETINEMCSERIVGRYPMSRTLLKLSIRSLSQLIDSIDSMLVSENVQLSDSQRLIMSRARRARQKLILRLKATRTFDVDAFIIQYFRQDRVTPLPTLQLPSGDYFKYSPMDVYDGSFVDTSSDPIPFDQQFRRRLMGDPLRSSHLDTESTVSAFSGRKLSRFLWRDFEVKPPLRQAFESIRSMSLESGERDSIDYAYLRPHHVPQVNELLCRLLWPQIDVTADLQYPDHAIVVLYRRRVIGCAIMELGPTSSYITYLAVDYGWRGCGIASTMMYLLTSMYRKKDVLLHVQPTNWNAMRVYQKWGFKAERFAVGFYDRYVPWSEGEGPGEWSTRGSRNAMFMRLRQK